MCRDPIPSVDELLHQALRPTPRGVVGLVEQLLDSCARSDVEFERVAIRCVCRLSVNGDVREAQVPLPPAAFRSILARIAALCDARSPDALSPSGGGGEVTVGGERPAAIRVACFNTPDRQRLKLRPLDAEGDETVGGGEQTTTW